MTAAKLFLELQAEHRQAHQQQAETLLGLI
jgi:hypothetical protein